MLTSLHSIFSVHLLCVHLPIVHSHFLTIGQPPWLVCNGLGGWAFGDEWLDSWRTLGVNVQVVHRVHNFTIKRYFSRSFPMKHVTSRCNYQTSMPYVCVRCGNTYLVGGEKYPGWKKFVKYLNIAYLKEIVPIHEILFLILEFLTNHLYIMVASMKIDKKNNLVRLKRNIDSCIQFFQFIVLLYCLLSHLFWVKMMAYIQNPCHILVTW
jgi:hypothetical protein